MQFQGKVHQKKEKGIVLLLALIVISVTVSISLSIVTITVQELRLAGYMRESERAFMAADRALECAMFWDRGVPLESATNGLQYTPFATSTAWNPSSININNVVCNRGEVNGNVRLNTLPGWLYTDGDATSRTTGPYTIVYDNGTSADVTVVKNGIRTTITANGYNVTNPAGNRRATQRTIVANYNL